METNSKSCRCRHQSFSSRLVPYVKLSTNESALLMLNAICTFMSHCFVKDMDILNKFGLQEHAVFLTLIHCLQSKIYGSSFHIPSPNKLVNFSPSNRWFWWRSQDGNIQQRHTNRYIRRQHWHRLQFDLEFIYQKWDAATFRGNGVRFTDKGQ